MSIFVVPHVFFPSVAFLAAWPAAPRIGTTLEHSLFFMGRTPYAPFSRRARSNQISEGTRSKKRLNISSKMRTQGTNIDVQKQHFLRPKWLPKWTPEASRNVCTRRSATEAAKNASWGAPRAPPDDFGAIFLPHRYPSISRDYPAHLISPTWAPGRTSLKEIE